MKFIQIILVSIFIILSYSSKSLSDYFMPPNLYPYCMEGKDQNTICRKRLDFESGVFYEGETLDNIPHGYGYQFNSKDDYYEGYFLNGTANGYGIWNFVNTNNKPSKYIGKFVNGCFEGRGIFIEEKGNVYSGKFKECELIDSFEISISDLVRNFEISPIIKERIDLNQKLFYEEKIFYRLKNQSPIFTDSSKSQIIKKIDTLSNIAVIYQGGEWSEIITSYFDRGWIETKFINFNPEKFVNNTNENQKSDLTKNESTSTNKDNLFENSQNNSKRLDLLKNKRKQNFKIYITIIIIFIITLIFIIQFRVREFNSQKTINRNTNIKKDKSSKNLDNREEVIYQPINAIKENIEEKKPSENTKYEKKTKIVKITEMSDEKIYELIAEEFDSNRRKGLWLKCEIESDMDPIKAKKLYVQTRYDEIKSSDEVKINEENQIDEKEELSPTIQALMNLRFKEELSLDGYDKLDKKFKDELIKYIYSVVEEYLNVQKSAVQTVGQKIQKEDSERNFLVYILFEYGCIDGMCIILNISPEVGQKISIEFYNLQNETFPDKKFDTQKRKDGIGELLTNQDTLEVAREIHQKGIKSVSQFLIEQDDKASLDIINFLNNKKIQFNFSENNEPIEEKNIDFILNEIADFYNNYKVGISKNKNSFKKFGKKQYEHIVAITKYFEWAIKHYDEEGSDLIGNAKVKASLILFSHCESKRIEAVDDDLNELLEVAELIGLSQTLVDSINFILGKNDIDDENDSQYSKKMSKDEYLEPIELSGYIGKVKKIRDRQDALDALRQYTHLPPGIYDTEGYGNLAYECGCGESHCINDPPFMTVIANAKPNIRLLITCHNEYLTMIRIKGFFGQSAYSEYSFSLSLIKDITIEQIIDNQV